MQDLLDRALGKYVIIEEIGRGGMGAVYKARDVELDRIVAIKVLSPYLVGEPRLVQRFMREARLAANLDHPNIVTIYDIGGEGSYYYFAMKYLDGVTLKEYVLENGPLSPDEVLPLVRQLTSALDYAHAQNLVHRDIKPGNVIISSDGHVCLTDFGLAKVAENLKLTASGDTIGTLEYMAPEQARGDAEKSSDIYSLGVIVYEMLAGRLPFQGNNQATLLYQHLHDPPPPLHQWNPSIPPEVEKAVLKAMAKEPADRYQTAGDFYEALEEATRKSLPVAPARRPMEPAKARPAAPATEVRSPRAASPGKSRIASVGERVPWLGRAWDKMARWFTAAWDKGAALVPWNRLPSFVQERRWIVPAALGTILVLLIVLLAALLSPSAPPVVIPPTSTPTVAPPPPVPTEPPSPTATPVPSPTATPMPTVPPEPVTAEIALVCGVNETGEGERPRLAHWMWGQGAPTVWPGLPNHPVVSLLSWSPDGDRVALIVAEFGVPNLFVVSREGELLKLTDSAANKSDPTWSPDGVQIGYANGPEKRRDIYLIPARGGEINDITNSPNFDEWAPAWSADGAYLLLAGKDSTMTNTEIFRLDPLSGERLRLTAAAGEDIFPSRSPNGSQVAFLSNRADLGSDFLIYVMDADGQNARLLYDQPVWLERPSWSPDGKWLVFTRRVAGELPQVVFLNTTSGEVYPGPSGCRRPAWKP
jgi:hypothetical protein